MNHLWHRDRFAEFCAKKAAVGEPRPHLQILMWLSKDVSLDEKLWRTGLYLNAYSIMTAEAIWSHWNYEEYSHDVNGFDDWLRANWAGVHTRKDRRAVRTPDNFLKCLHGYAEWFEFDSPKLRSSDYNMWWNSLLEVPFFGEYILGSATSAMKSLGVLTASQPDLRTALKSSPRRGMALLFPPELSMIIMQGPPLQVEALVEPLLTTFNVTWYQFSTLICEYHQAFEKGYEYPGNCHDEELEYLNGKQGDYWRQEKGLNTNIWEARKALFPAEVLGEISGWKKLRKEPGSWLKSHGVVWSDLEYDYHRSVAKGEPIPW